MNITVQKWKTEYINLEKKKKAHEGILPNEKISTRIRECLALCSNGIEATSACFQLK